MKKKKWLTRREAWDLAEKLAEKLGNIQEVAKKIDAATSTIYKWGSEPDAGPPDARITLELRELAIKEGIIKS